MGDAVAQTAEDGPQLDLSNMGRKVWLVKIPAGVAEAWRDSADGTELGVLRMTRPKQAGMKRGMTMHLNKPDAQGKAKQPRMVSQYKLSEGQQRSVTDMLLFSEDPTSAQLAIEGTIAHRADAQPEVSLEYTALMQARSLACKPERETQPYTETRRELSQRNIFTVKPPPTMRADPLDKRVRMEKSELQARLFEVFQQHQYYRIQHLVDKTQQPMQWLKEVLKEIAVHHTKGDHKNEWELKTEYQAYTAEDGA